MIYLFCIDVYIHICMRIFCFILWQPVYVVNIMMGDGLVTPGAKASTFIIFYQFFYNNNINNDNNNNNNNNDNNNNNNNNNNNINI